MRYCTNCGQPVRERAKFCPNCGFRLREPQPTAAAVPPEAGPDPGATMPLRVEDLRQYEELAAAPATQTVALVDEDAAVATTQRMPPLAPKRKHKWYRPGPLTLLVIVAVTVLAYVVSLVGVDPHKANIYWYVARGTGFISYAFLSLAVALGTFVGSKWRQFTPPWYVAERLHPLCLLLSGAFLSFHLVALLLLNVPALILFVPGVPSSRVFKAGMGIIAMYLMIALTFSTYVIGRIGFKVWKRIHYFGFLAWIGATVHGILAGHDTGSLWAQAFYWVGALMVGAVTIYYLASRAARTLQAGYPLGGPRSGSPPARAG